MSSFGVGYRHLDGLAPERPDKQLRRVVRCFRDALSKEKIPHDQSPFIGERRVARNDSTDVSYLS